MAARCPECRTTSKRSWWGRSLSWLSPWKSFPGRYTRLGDVKPLLSASDDAFVISRPGDEIQLSFDAEALPAVRPGWARTFLLLGDGYSKEMDINSSSPDIVLPLPYHGMASYPYPESERPRELARLRRTIRDGAHGRHRQRRGHSRAC